jgi:hypothetical protein
MIIMCLVTTFMVSMATLFPAFMTARYPHHLLSPSSRLLRCCGIQTCPVVNCIYPVHLRVLANDVHKVKSDIETGDGNYNGDVEDSKQEEGETSAMVAKGARLCVIVDRMEHLQGLMDLLSCFIPYTSNSKLAVIGTCICAYY